MNRQMLLLYSLYFFALTPYSVSAMTDEQRNKIREEFKTLGMECIKQHFIAEEDIKNLMASKMATGENVPCFLACIMKKAGIMDNEGMLQKEGVLEQAKKVFEDEEELKRIGDYLHSCSHVNTEAVGDGDKGCERASIAYKCMMENASQFGFEI